MVLDRLRPPLSSRQAFGTPSLTFFRTSYLVQPSATNNTPSQRPFSHSVEVGSAPYKRKPQQHNGDSQGTSSITSIHNQVAKAPGAKTSASRRKANVPGSASKPLWLGHYIQQNTRRDAGFSPLDYESSLWIPTPTHGIIEDIFESPSKNVIGYSTVAISGYKRLPERTIKEFAMADDMGAVAPLLLTCIDDSWICFYKLPKNI